ncbi:hypothetical protein [Pseudochryseolinea flava]|uniref:Outer membrane protein beta-barrel domain-containing protein n=1 Tax=Pseudochryseolinea flava TaxID=2059302 RepID=A0A364Y5R0_9BACT|nr:hypothetical protein [Pseudochryseolinea flava]RAW01177.1 hypothetical protein DQQ10_09685 [Pseudochryseolinea flava]
MKKIYCIAFLVLTSLAANAQDEGAIVKKERLALSQGVFVGLGPSITFGKNIGDYGIGFNAEIGFMKRLNRVLSIGPSLSYQTFKYDAEETGSNNAFLGDETQNDNGDYFIPGMVVDFDGGTINMYSLSVNFKLNFIPVTDNSKVSVYGFAKPFVSMASRTDVKGDARIFAVYDEMGDGAYDEEDLIFGYNNYYIDLPWEAGDPTWSQLGIDISDDLKAETKVTGGIFIGPGVEFMPAKKVSIYAQLAFGYTFPVSFISTEKYEGNDLNKVDEKYPIVEEGFPSLNVQAGVSFNF